MDLEQKILINEVISEGKELAEQLISSKSSPEKRRLLIEKILFSYEKSISLLNSEVSSVENNRKINPILDSPLSCANSSPMSDFGDQECMDNSPKHVNKKRKTEARWTKQVKVCSGTGLDGYNWRKYGQKDIFGANFPRGYYRCSHRHSQGCLATKQVQRSDQDPTMFEVTYKGRHTCFQTATPCVIKEKTRPKNKDTFDQFEQHEEKPKPKPNPKSIILKQLSFNYRDGIKIQEFKPSDEIFPSFSFPNVDDGNVENNIFMMENFMSPTISGLSISPCEMYSFGLDYNVTTPPSESDSNPASVTNSPIGEWDILIDFTDFEANFPLETQELYAKC